MIAQYTQAALVSENKRLASPASVDSIPSSAMQEDHVSMGWSSARKLRQAIDNLTKIVGIELMTAARAIDLRAPLHPSPITGAAVAELRKTSPGPGPDRFLAPDMQALQTPLQFYLSVSRLNGGSGFYSPTTSVLFNHMIFIALSRNLGLIFVPIVFLNQGHLDQVMLENAERAALGTEKPYDRSIP
jgi:hypothetical protein